MKSYVAYKANGEIVLEFTCFEEQRDANVPAGMGVLEVPYDVTAATHWVSNGQLVAYTPEQASLKASPPGFGYIWDETTKSWIDDIPASSRTIANRVVAYPPIGDQLDMFWHAMNDGVIPKIEPFYSDIKAVKDKYPKSPIA